VGVVEGGDQDVHELATWPEGASGTACGGLLLARQSVTGVEKRVSCDCEKSSHSHSGGWGEASPRDELCLGRL
jgi:hypothetical protein